MMKTIDFKIGNLILLDGQVREISHLHDGFFSVILQKEPPVYNPSLSFNDKRLEGIQLTKEWLLKFGFKRFTDQEDYAIDLNLPNKKLYIPLDKDYEARVTWHLNMFSIAKNIKYVHKLQNLYYALTGEELKLV